MAVVDFLNTFRIQTDEPIDSRFVLTDEEARFTYPEGALYNGLVVFQLDNDTLYVLTDKINRDTADAWTKISPDDLVSGFTSEPNAERYRTLSLVLTSGEVITIPNAVRDGLDGSKGDTGADGSRGEMGATGAAGAQGVQGEQGDPGPQGDMGLPGDEGAKGDKGETGMTGPKGEQGSTGSKGDQGVPGMDGTDGQTGPQGNDGPQGPRGAIGPMGDQGIPGSDATVTKEAVDDAIGTATQGYYYNSDHEWVVIPDPTKGQIDRAIGADIPTSLRYYSEDGQFRTLPTGGGGNGGPVYYDDVIDIPIQRNRVVNIFTVTGTRGNVVPSGSNQEFATITIRNDYDVAGNGSFTFIPDVQFTIYGLKAIFNRSFTGSNLTEYITQIGNDAAALDDLITWDGIITTTLLNGVPASQITLDMGVTTSVNSAFSLSGSNIEATINNESTGGSPPTSVTALLGGEEVFTFNASALGINDNNINFVGTVTATGINNTTEFPVNWQAEYQNNVSQQEIVITSDVAGPQPTWSFVVDNNGITGANAGDIGFDGPTFDTVQANLIDIITFPDGTFQTTAATGGGGSGPDFGNILLQGTISFEGTDGIDVNGATADYLTYTNLPGSPYYRIFTANGTGETITINDADASVAANIYQSKTY